jgi:hypothetical protein
MSDLLAVWHSLQCAFEPERRATAARAWLLSELVAALSPDAASSLLSVAQPEAKAAIPAERARIDETMRDERNVASTVGEKEALA